VAVGYTPFSANSYCASCAGYVRLLLISMERHDAQNSGTAISSTNRHDSSGLQSAWRPAANSDRASCATHARLLLIFMEHHDAQDSDTAISSTNKLDRIRTQSACRRAANSDRTSCPTLIKLLLIFVERYDAQIRMQLFLQQIGPTAASPIRLGAKRQIVIRKLRESREIALDLQRRQRCPRFRYSRMKPTSQTP